MAASGGQRMAAFLLAGLFLLTTIGAAGFVIFELNSESDGGLVDDATTNQSVNDIAQQQNQAPSIVGTLLANFTGPVEVPELRFEDEVEGTGDEVQPGQTVTIHYTGALASDGTIFDSSLDGSGEPATFPLGNLIQGWQDGIPGMKVGGKRRLFIPAAQGYGEAGSGASIPPNSDLVFDIELFATE